MDDLRSLAEAADDLGIAPVTLRAAIARGRFAARKFGQTWVTTRQEVERYRRESLGNPGRPKAYEGSGASAGAAVVDTSPEPDEPGAATGAATRRVSGHSKWSEIKRKKGPPER